MFAPVKLCRPPRFALRSSQLDLRKHPKNLRLKLHEKYDISNWEPQQMHSICWGSQFGISYFSWSFQSEIFWMFAEVKWGRPEREARRSSPLDRSKHSKNRRRKAELKIWYGKLKNPNKCLYLSYLEDIKVWKGNAEINLYGIKRFLESLKIAVINRLNYFKIDF